MQMWMIAMLAVSTLLIVWDMAKLIFTDKKKNRPIYDIYPQKEKIERYAKSFQKLAHTFYDMPKIQEKLTHSEIQGIFQEVREQVCNRCPQNDTCWGAYYHQTCDRVYDLLQIIEEEEGEHFLHAQGQWLVNCQQAAAFTQEVRKVFLDAKKDLLYRNQWMENRLAVAQQLQEVACTIQKISCDVSEVTSCSQKMEDQIRTQLAKHHIQVKQIWMLSRVDEKWKIFMTMCMCSGQCMTMREIGRQLSVVCKKNMVPSKESRSILNGDTKTCIFVEDVNYKVLYGVSKITKERETVSGDNYICTSTDEQYILCLSDGMGSGIEACRESETVVDLMEQFLLAGFSRETAAKMVNATLILHRKNGMFSSIDLCVMNLYTGICEILKVGAAATFIRRDTSVEMILSESMPAGLTPQLDFEITNKKLYDGDYVIMVTDGVLDALGQENQEKIMKEIILQNGAYMPQEMSRAILEKVLHYSNYQVQDDMTILVAGIWKK